MFLMKYGLANGEGHLKTRKSVEICLSKCERHLKTRKRTVLYIFL